MKTSLKKILGSLIVTCALFGANAHAILLDLNSIPYDYIFSGNDSSPGSQDYFAKNDGTTAGPLSAYITTVIAGKNITATWNPAGSIEFDWLNIKSGNGYVGWIFGDSFDWSAYTGFKYTNDDILNANGNSYVGISHADGSGGYTTTQVPEGGTTALLLGFAMVAGGMIARRRSA